MKIISISDVTIGEEVGSIPINQRGDRNNQLDRSSNN